MNRVRQKLVRYSLITRPSRLLDHSDRLVQFGVPYQFRDFQLCLYSMESDSVRDINREHWIPSVALQCCCGLKRLRKTSLWGLSVVGQASNPLAIGKCH
jgi:hypothetical protein